MRLKIFNDIRHIVIWFNKTPINMISPTPINLVKIKDLSEFYDCYVEDATDLLFQDCVYLEEGETFKAPLIIAENLINQGIAEQVKPATKESKENKEKKEVKDGVR